jgi:hypothetical protein
MHFKRVCNVTDDADFDVNQFLYNTSSDYYDECDCVLYMNCTVFVPELPPSGGSDLNCSYTCEDIAKLQTSVGNLSS